MNAGEMKKHIIERINKNINMINSISDADTRPIESLDIKQIMAIMSYNNAQSNSALLERMLINKGLTKVSASLDKGDFAPSKLNNKNIELKASFPNKSNVLNIRQIRLWQDCDYVITYCDYDNFNNKTYFLTHDQMALEVSKRGSATHGTKKS